MSQAASQYAAFVRDACKSKLVWTIKDEGGYPAPLTSSGERSAPFWSSLSRVKKIIKNVPAYAGFVPVEITYSHFVEKWIPGCAKDGYLIGVNWSGPNAVGYDVKPEDLLLSLEHEVKRAGGSTSHNSR